MAITTQTPCSPKTSARQDPTAHTGHDVSPSITPSALQPEKQAPAVCKARPAGYGAVPPSTGPRSATLPQTPANAVPFWSRPRPGRDPGTGA